MIIFDGGFYTELDDERIVSINGKLGAGKTLLAFTLAERYLKRGYSLITNVSSIWGDDWNELGMGEDGSVKAVVLVDEGGIYIRSLETVAALSAFARKLDLYVIISGKREPHEEMLNLQVVNWFDAGRNILFPMKVWKWKQTGSDKWYGGLIWEVGSSGFWGIYDTVDPGRSPNLLVKLVDGFAKELSERYGYEEYGLFDVAHGGRDSVRMEAASQAARAARELRGVVSILAERKKGKRDRKGRK